MEAYFSHIARKIDKLRFSEQIPKSVVFEFCSVGLWRACLAEFIGTMLYVFLGCSSTLLWDDSRIPHEMLTPFVFGLTEAGMIEYLFHVSGAHINPAVSFGFLVSMAITPLRTLMYIISQCLGATAAGAILYGGHLGAHLVNPNLHTVQALVIELILTFILMSVILGAEDFNKVSFSTFSLVIGLTVTACLLTAKNSSGGGMNPARALGPAIFSGHWDRHWIFWAGPFTGAALAVVVYKYMLDPYRHAKTIDQVEQDIVAQRPQLAIPPDFDVIVSPALAISLEERVRSRRCSTHNGRTTPRVLLSSSVGRRNNFDFSHVTDALQSSV
ncbi:aquaporin-like [Liolophura sinensis]|uniref:aquaporin-like n=1 Tax=Liolophura sinensis TaxID=3198878 RepID=UPI003158A1E3